MVVYTEAEIEFLYLNWGETQIEKAAWSEGMANLRRRSWGVWKSCRYMDQ